MADKALIEGARVTDFQGQFRRYLDHLSAEYHRNNLRIMGHIIFAFQDDRLVTAFHVPRKLRNQAQSK
jgi:hypothetical protein